MSGQGSRYQRSTSGLIGAMAVTLLVIGAFVAFRALTRDDLERQSEPVDYLAAAGYAQDDGLTVVYPETLPAGWIATSVDLTRGERPEWGLGLLTDAGRFAGLRQQDSSLDDLLETYVDQDAQELSPVQVTGSVAPTWQVFEDDGGDLAFSAEVGDETVLVYGSATRAELLGIVEELTVDRVSA